MYKRIVTPSESGALDELNWLKATILLASYLMQSISLSLSETINVDIILRIRPSMSCLKLYIVKCAINGKIAYWQKICFRFKQKLLARPGTFCGHSFLVRLRTYWKLVHLNWALYWPAHWSSPSSSLFLLELNDTSFVENCHFEVKEKPPPPALHEPNIWSNSSTMLIC